MTLLLHRATRTDRLADQLAELLAVPPADPFVEDVVVVPARGVERWLTQRLSHRLGAAADRGDGICAGVRFLSPRSLTSLLLDRERDDPWDADRLVWPLLTTIDESLGEAWCADLARHLGHGVEGVDGELRRSRRWSVARRLAGLYASYADQRPALVTDWREGRDTDGAGGTLAPDLSWQPELWRRLLARVGGEAPDQRHARVCAGLRSGDLAVDLPDRVSLLGHTRLSRSEVELLGALGATRDVHLWLPQPSPVLWEALGELLGGLPGGEGAGGVVRRSDDPSAEWVGHPLLASLGRDTRELRRALAVAEPVDATAPEPETEPPTTLLARLQHDLRRSAVPDEVERAARVHDPADRSLQVHACHGPARQVDVLREVLVGLLADDPTLEPRDILVMCPDIEAYAPLVSAGFGLTDVVDEREGGHPAHRLRVRLADRALTSTNPLLAVAARLVELAGGRVTASEVLDLLAEPPVRARFALNDDDLARVTRWVGQAGVRWGIDATQRSRFAMELFEHNTWRSGIDRLLLGVAMSGDDHRHLGRGLPVDDVGSGDIDLVGRLAEVLDRLGTCLAGLARAEDAGGWTEVLAQGVRDLCQVGGTEGWQLPQVERELARVAADAGSGVPLRLADVRAILRHRLGGRPTRASFRTGSLTVCTMTPMRSVPHRVVALVGLDDGVFPRQQSVDGDDVLARDPLTGERDARSEDRQLMLDAVLAATQTLVITYTGANEHSGAERPPAVPLGELLDAADRTCAAPVREHVLVRHPLQAHDARNFERARLVAAEPRPFSFDTAGLAGALAARDRVQVGAFLTHDLPPTEPGDVSLADLKAFLAHPVRTFLRERLRVTSPLEADETADAIPIQVGGLEKWDIGDRLLRQFLTGEQVEEVMHAELLRGTLPPFELGESTLRRIVSECQDLFTATTTLREGHPPTSRDIEIDLGGGRRLTGTVPGIFVQRVITAGYSSLKAKQRLLTWVDLLALSVAFPDEHWTGHAIGKGYRTPDGYVQGPVDHRAEEWLRDLVALLDEGLCRPLPLPVETAAGRAAEVLGRGAGSRRPTDAWEGSEMIPGERDDAWHVRVWGESAPLSLLREHGLDDLAPRIWQPVFSCERKVRL